MTKEKILIIDDEDKLRENISELLTLHGYITRTASNGQLGLQMIEQFHPDLILCDIRMPHKDGLSLLKELRAAELNSNIPLILISAKVERSDVRTGMDAGADDYLTKPFSKEELLNAIRTRIIRKVKQNQEAEVKAKAMVAGMSDGDLNEYREKVNSLTKSEKRILGMIAKNKTSRQIADELFVSFKTIENHRSNISRKLGLKGTLSLVSLAIRLSPFLDDGVA